MDHVLASKCHKVSELSSQKNLDAINKSYGMNYSKQSGGLTFWKNSVLLTPISKERIWLPAFRLCHCSTFWYILQKIVEIQNGPQKRVLNIFWRGRNMFYMTCKHIVSQNIMHPRGTEMLIFWIIQNIGKWVFVPVGCK